MKRLFIATCVLTFLLTIQQHPSSTKVLVVPVNDSAQLVEAAKVAPTRSTLPKIMSPSRARSYASTLMLRGQFHCLDKLWTRESNWRHKAANPSSSAYGIPQILHLSKKLSTVQQIGRGLQYISERYGTPCKALAHSMRFNWY
jgi:hypothetical protein